MKTDFARVTRRIIGHRVLAWASAALVVLVPGPVPAVSGQSPQPTPPSTPPTGKGPHRPQLPTRPYPYSEEHITYENKKAGVRLAATLTLPSRKGPFPAVLLITGSGPQDRDESIVGHKPFLVLADYLTRRGVAVLRADDRGVGQSTGNFFTATSADFAEDARAGVEYLARRKEINPRQIGLIGHSEGGLIAPLLAAHSSDIAFIVMLAGQGLPGDEVLYLQGEKLLKASGASAEQINRQRELQTRLFALVKAETDPNELERKFRAIVDAEVAKFPEGKTKEATQFKADNEAQIGMVKSPWLRYFIGYDPRPDVASGPLPGPCSDWLQGPSGRAAA
jgi:dienelactone hydrolase